MAVFRGIDEWVQSDIWKCYFSNHVVRLIDAQFDYLRYCVGKMISLIEPEDMVQKINYEYDYVYKSEREFLFHYKLLLMLQKRQYSGEVISYYVDVKEELLKKTECLKQQIDYMKNISQPIKYVRNKETKMWFVVPA